MELEAGRYDKCLLSYWVQEHGEKTRKGFLGSCITSLNYPAVVGYEVILSRES